MSFDEFFIAHRAAVLNQYVSHMTAKFVLMC